MENSTARQSTERRAHSEERSECESELSKLNTRQERGASGGGGGGGRARAVEAAYHVLDMKSLAPASTCSVSTKGFHGMQIVHRYGPCSPLGQENSPPDSRQILIKDQARVRSMNSLTSNSKYATNGEGIVTADSFPPQAMTLFGRDIGAGNYVVKAGFGTPKRDFNLIFDTGSDLTWLRCGSNGYQPSESSTSTNATCNSGPTCNFNVDYGDHSSASGYFIRDYLTLKLSDMYSDAFSNFYFGCGLQISPGFGSADGLLGVGQSGNLSIISQTDQMYAKVFCYCLPESDSSAGFLLFGFDAQRTCKTKTTTPLSRDLNRPAYYFVNLIGITIGDQRLGISSKTIMDSGTVITRLPSPVYSALRSEFMKFMSKYPRAKPTTQQQDQLLDTCYDLEGYGNVTLPNMVLQFPKFQVNLDPSAVIWKERESDSQVCLAFAGNDDIPDKLTIIGNHQQRTLKVLYDIKNNKVGFGMGGCAN
ncbi:hypothetical protein EZV62_013670 [Acer yangbiense]|uniref:Peptidase A1 domain-containing protein n=1 Tax=Acer yangbiense TaxID=1000413 RepID=A0A5C7HYZ6_9ROSI|nr:hypothetical protein EZV62_013670 [Acer yangbiense]